MAKINNWGSDDPAEETKGGTGTATFSTGDILYSDSSNSLAKLGIGSSTQALTVDSGIPSWASLPISGDHDWTLISTTSPTSGAAVQITSGLGTAYEDFLVMMDDVTSTTNSAILDLGFSDDGGSTYAVSLIGQRTEEAQSTTPITGFSSSAIVLSVTGGTPTNYSGYFFWSGNKTATYKMVTLGQDEIGPSGWAYNYFGVLTTNNDIDAIELTYSAGTFTSGDIYIYGR